MFRFEFHHRLARGLVIVLEIAAFFALTVRIGKNCLADWASDGTSAEELTRAVRLDPGNAEYHLRLARLALYSVANADTELAKENLERASGLSPRNVQVWLELAAAFGFQGDSNKAEIFLRRADRMAPRIPAIQWVVGNFYLLQGNIDEAFKHFNVTLSGTRQYDGILFRTAWKATDNGTQILNELVPPRVDTEFSYLNYLVGEKKLAETMAVWKRIAASPEKFEASRVRGFMDHLFAARMRAEADQVWNDLRAKGLISPVYQPTAQNLVINGDFEEEVLNLGYDWRIQEMAGVSAGRDESQFHSPNHAMKLNFAGKSNLAYWHVYQFVKVEPKRRYRLQAFLRTEGITTDSGPRLRVIDPDDPAHLLEFSEDVSGSTRGWNLIDLEIATGPATQFIMVSLARQPSTKLDNLIAGIVWLDDVSLTPLR